MNGNAHLYLNQSYRHDAIAVYDRLQKFFNTCGYTNEQINGSRILEIMNAHEFKEPEKGSEVFVKNIPETVYEDTLLPLFNSIGTVYRMRYMLCFSGAGKGYCYVQYLNSDVAASAIEKLNNYKMPGRNKRLYVTKSIDNCRLFVGNIPKEIGRKQLESELRKRMEDIREIFFYADSQDPNKNRGFVFVDFKTHRSAALSRRKEVTINGNRLQLDWAAVEEEVEESLLSEIKNIFIRCIPPTVSQHDIRQTIKNIVPTHVYFKVKKINDFAFVEFSDHESAKNALGSLKDKVIKGYKVIVMWANPQKKNNSKMIENGSECTSNTTVAVTHSTMVNKYFVFPGDGNINGTNGVNGIHNSFSLNNGVNQNAVPEFYGCESFPPTNAVVNGCVPNYGFVNGRLPIIQERNNVPALQSPPAQPEFSGTPAWPVYFSPLVPDVTFNEAKRVLQLCNYRCFEALQIFAREMGWGEIICQITPQCHMGSTLFCAKIQINEAPIDVQSALLGAQKCIHSNTEEAARELAACNVWKMLFPYLQLPPVFTPYVF